MWVIFLPDNTGIQRHSSHSVRLTHRVDGIVLLCLGEVEGIDLLRPDVFLADDAGRDVVLPQDAADAEDAQAPFGFEAFWVLVERVEMVDGVVEAVHPVLVNRQTWHTPSYVGIQSYS